MVEPSTTDHKIEASNLAKEKDRKKVLICGGSTVVEHFTADHEMKGSKPAKNRKWQKSKKNIYRSCVLSVVTF